MAVTIFRKQQVSKLDKNKNPIEWVHGLSKSGLITSRKSGDSFVCGFEDLNVTYLHDAMTIDELHKAMTLAAKVI